MVEVFRTNVTIESDASAITGKIREYFPEYIINFDLQDCDHVLRIESGESVLHSETILGIVRAMGFEVDFLPDFVAEDRLTELIN